MSRVLIIGDCLIDHYKFYNRVRHDPATVDVPVMKLIKEIKVDGGASLFEIFSGAFYLDMPSKLLDKFVKIIFKLDLTPFRNQNSPSHQAYSLLLDYLSRQPFNKPLFSIFSGSRGYC